MWSPPKSRKAYCRACCFCLESMLHDAGSAGSPEFQKLRKKNLVDSALSWFKMLRASSMNQKFPYILRISEKAKAIQGLIGPVADWQMPEEITSLALDLTWRVLICRDNMKWVVVRETATTLVPHGSIDDAAACQTAAQSRRHPRENRRRFFAAPVSRVETNLSHVERGVLFTRVCCSLWAQSSTCSR